LKKFKNSVSKILNYELLAEFLHESSSHNSTIVDLGSGDCSLMNILTTKYLRKTIGIEIDVEKVEYGRSKGFNIINSNINNVSKTFHTFSDSMTVHAGFCLFNIFSLNDIKRILEGLSLQTDVIEIFFELQNKKYFINRYPAFKKHKTKLEDILLISWNTPFLSPVGNGVQLIMEYYNKSGKLINKTLDTLYHHDADELLDFCKHIGFKMTKKKIWPIRSATTKNSHFYIHSRRKNE